MAVPFSWTLRSLLKFVACGTLLALASGCASTLEMVEAAQEPPSVEMALDRINSAARVIELEEIILRAMPISAASTWPAKVDKPIPDADYGRLAGASAPEALLKSFGKAHLSPVRIKAMAVQTILFETAPDMHYQRKYIDTDPGPEVIRAFGGKVLGENYSPAFNPLMYRFLKYSPDFIPKREHFTAKRGDRAAEYFAGVEEAVLSLAENAEQLRAIRSDMEEISDKKKRALRDINDNAREIGRLKDEDGNKNAAEISSLEEEIKTHRKEYDDAAAQFEGRLAAWRMELAKIKHQSAAFDGEQAALAANIQAAVSAIKGFHYDSITVITIALVRLPDSLMNIDKEVRHLMKSPLAEERIKRITASAVALFDNATIIKNEIFQIYAEADAMDGLFDARIKTAVSKPAKEK